MSKKQTKKIKKHLKKICKIMGMKNIKIDDNIAFNIDYSHNFADVVSVEFVAWKKDGNV